MWRLFDTLSRYVHSLQQKDLKTEQALENQLDVLCKHTKYYTKENEAYLEIQVSAIREKKLDHLIPDLQCLDDAAYLWSPQGQTFYTMHLRESDQWDGMSDLYFHANADPGYCRLAVTEQRALPMHRGGDEFCRMDNQKTRAFLRKLMMAKDITVVPYQANTERPTPLDALVSFSKRLCQ